MCNNNNDTLLKSANCLHESSIYTIQDTQNADLEMEDVSKADNPAASHGELIAQSNIERVIHEWKNLSNLHDSQNINFHSQNQNHLSFINSYTDSSVNSVNDINSIKGNENSITYNKIIQLLDEVLVKENSVHNFLECNVCCNYYMQAYGDYNETFSLFNIINPLGNRKIGNTNATDTEFAELFKSIVKEIKDKNKCTNENVTIKEKKKFNYNISQFSVNSMDMSVNIFSELAKLKMQKFFSNMKHMTQLHTVVNNILNVESDTVKNMVSGNKYSYGRICGDMELDYELLSFLIPYLQNISQNKTGILVNIIDKINAVEQSMTTELFIFIKEFFESLKSSKHKLIEIPDLSPFKELFKRINLTTNNVNSDSDSSSLEGDFKNKQPSVNAFIETERLLNNNIEIDEDLICGDVGSNITTDGNESDSSSSSSRESNADLILDCENELIRIPPKKCFFLAFSNLKKSKIKKIYELAYRMEFGVSKEYIRGTTTHVIIPDKWQEKTFTYQYLAAIAHQSSIITFNWVTDCLEADRILPITSYIPNLPGALSCLNKSRMLLFESYSLCIHSAEGLQIKDQNQHLAEACGAEVVTSIIYLYGKRTNGKRVLVSEISPNSELLMQCINLGVYPVHLSWMHDSIIKYAVQPLEPYSLIDISETNFELSTGVF